MNTDGALVLFSGGQDSTTCLAWSLARFKRVETVGFDYGQRHRAEMDARLRVLAAIRARFSDWAERLGDDHVLSLDMLKAIGGSALTDATKIEMGADGLPTTFVPGRNVMFLTAAAALGYRRGIADLVGGMCETDFSGYPDCRDKTMAADRRGADARPRPPRHAFIRPDVDRQGGDLGAGGRTRRRGAGRSDPSRKPSPATKATARSATIGAWLRRLPGLRFARQGLCEV